MPERRIPCPFCGSTEIGSNSTFGTVWCEQCTRALKIAEWQSRPIEDALRAEVERLNGRFDTAHQVIAHRENECAMLRAEVAALKAENQKMHHDWMADHAELEFLKDDLAKRDEPLTDEQRKVLFGDMDFCNAMDTDALDLIDAAIRRVRRGE